jgi:hypothetical protein
VGDHQRLPATTSDQVVESKLEMIKARAPAPLLVGNRGFTRTWQPMMEVHGVAEQLGGHGRPLVGVLTWTPVGLPMPNFSEQAPVYY